MPKEKWRRDCIKKGLMLLLILLACLEAESHTLRVAVIDTGYNINGKAIICNSGNYDVMTDTPVIAPDQWGHGTEMINIISDYAKGDYCIIVIRVFNNHSGETKTITKGIYKAIEAHADVISESIGSVIVKNRNEHEALIIAHKRGIKVFLSSGNEGVNLDNDCYLYPVCYKDTGVIVVGSDDDKRANKGKIVTIKEKFCIKETCGTSASTAIAVGKYIREKNQ